MVENRVSAGAVEPLRRGRAQVYVPPLIESTCPTM